MTYIDGYHRELILQLDNDTGIFNYIESVPNVFRVKEKNVQNNWFTYGMIISEKTSDLKFICLKI